MSLRRYPHPGKFEGGLLIDQIPYLFALEGGADEEESNPDWGESAQLISGPITLESYPGIVSEVSPDGLTPEEIEFLSSHAGCIVHEDTQGFVSVDWYETHAELESAWRGVAESFAPEDEDSEDE